tara:strand:+ start:178 stop:339 length:162 start_codon:yes stop_codon:yes gene_type:complete
MQSTSGDVHACAARTLELALVLAAACACAYFGYVQHAELVAVRGELARVCGAP